MTIAWAVEWRSKNSRYFMWGKPHNGVTPILFRTKREAQEWITKNHGYIANRKDLRAEPFGWRMPQPVAVEVTLVRRRQQEDK